MMTISIRPEQQKDYEAIYEVNKAAFGGEGESILVENLRKIENFIPELSLVAAVNKSIVGHILFTKIHIVSQSGMRHESLALAPMAVHPDVQKKGVGGQLIKGGLAEAAKLGHSSVIVLGHEHYYPKFGFVPASTWQIQAPFSVPDAFFMAIELVPGALTNISGTVEYPAEFSSV